MEKGVITVTARPIASFLVGSTSLINRPVCPSLNSPDPNNVDYLWDFKDGFTFIGDKPCHTYAAEGCYDITLEATGPPPDFCKAADTNTVCINRGEAFLVPNAFTPIGSGSPDGKADVDPSFTDDTDNNVFYPFIIGDVSNYKMQIYNKWGELIFETTDHKIGWNGFYRNKLAKQDVYVFSIDVIITIGNEASEFSKTGYVMLLR